MINKVILLGNVGQAPTIKEMQSGDKIATFSLATSESYKDKNGDKQTLTEWHNVVCFKRTAEIVEMFVNKGSKLYIEGKIKTEEFEGKYYTKIQAFTIQMLDSKPKDGQQAKNHITGDSVAPELKTEVESGDLPF